MWVANNKKRPCKHGHDAVFDGKHMEATGRFDIGEGGGCVEKRVAWVDKMEDDKVAGEEATRQTGEPP